MITIGRSHEICAGHRVCGHEGKCAHLHGHAYVFEFEVSAPVLDALGRVIDFSVIKARLCDWLERNWDHRMLLWAHDPLLPELRRLDPDGVVALALNPTAENLAQLMVDAIAPQQLYGTDVTLVACTVHETSKCWARAQVRQ